MMAQGRVPPGASERVGAVIVAAGESRRMAGVDKVFAPLLGRLLISHSLEAFIACTAVTDIVLVLSQDNVAKGQALLEARRWSEAVDIRVGGERRQDSVLLGLEGLQDTDWTVVHDGARPCIDVDTIIGGLAEARKTGAAVAAVRVKDTIKVAGADMVVTETLARDRLWAVQTPQVFRTDILYEAHQRISQDVTDDAAMVEQTGHPVSIFTGSYDNVKVTTAEDLLVAETFLRARERREP